VRGTRPLVAANRDLPIAPFVATGAGLRLPIEGRRRMWVTRLDNVADIGHVIGMTTDAGATEMTNFEILDAQPSGSTKPSGARGSRRSA
jgi:hypothetical protein